MSRSEIQALLPYEIVHETQVERIIDVCYEEGIITVTPERGPDKFKLNCSQFDQLALQIINGKALARMTNPAEERGDPVPVDDIPDEFFVYQSRSEVSEETDQHTDYSDLESRFHNLNTTEKDS
jgi:hypothetical protein